jgi:hypothetical protein
VARGGEKVAKCGDMAHARFNQGMGSREREREQERVRGLERARER